MRVHNRTLPWMCLHHRHRALKVPFKAFLISNAIDNLYGSTALQLKTLFSRYLICKIVYSQQKVTYTCRRDVITNSNIHRLEILVPLFNAFWVCLRRINVDFANCILNFNHHARHRRQQHDSRFVS